MQHRQSLVYLRSWQSC